MPVTNAVEDKEPLVKGRLRHTNTEIDVLGMSRQMALAVYVFGSAQQRRLHRGGRRALPTCPPPSPIKHIDVGAMTTKYVLLVHAAGIPAIARVSKGVHARAGSIIVHSPPLYSSLANYRI